MGSGASKAPSPALRKYFQTMESMTVAHTKETDMNPAAMIAMAFDEAKQRAFEEKEQRFTETLAKKLKPHIEKSFVEHNKNKDDFLDQAESSLWFSHFVFEKTKFDQAMLSQMQRLAIKTAVATMKQMMGSDAAKSVGKQMEDCCKANLEKLNAKLAEMDAHYKANKAECDKAAFAVLDVNKDGKLQMGEVVEVLSPGNPRFDELMKALGYDTKALVEELGSSSLDAGACCVM